MPRDRRWRNRTPRPTPPSRPLPRCARRWAGTREEERRRRRTAWERSTGRSRAAIIFSIMSRGTWHSRSNSSRRCVTSATMVSSVISAVVFTSPCSTAASRATSTLTSGLAVVATMLEATPQERRHRRDAEVCETDHPHVSLISWGLGGAGGSTRLAQNPRPTREHAGRSRDVPALSSGVCPGGGTASSEATVGPGTAALPRRPLPREIVLWSQALSPPNAIALSSWFLIERRHARQGVVPDAATKARGRARFGDRSNPDVIRCI